MKAIIGTRTDHTRVYGYLSIDVLDDDGAAVPDGEARLPRSIREELREQYDSPSDRGLARVCDEVATVLGRLGWTVLEEDGTPYQATTKA